MAKLRLTQVKSVIDKPERQKRIIQALGFRKVNHTVEQENTPEIMGMIEKVKHLITIEEI